MPEACPHSQCKAELLYPSDVLPAAAACTAPHASWACCLLLPRCLLTSDGYAGFVMLQNAEVAVILGTRAQADVLLAAAMMFTVLW
jgi:hypothetical protein